MQRLFSGLKNVAGLFATHPLTRDAPIKAWARFAAWQIRARLQDESIEPWIEGQKLAMRLGMTGATGNLYVGLHEFEDMAFLLHFLRAGDLFLDVGANVGSYSVLASGVRRARSWAFEPDPQTARRLARNIAVNDLDALAAIHQCALGDSEGETSFTVGCDTMNKVTSASAGAVQRVPLATLDAIVGAARPAMMKMDVEGYEDYVLRGARRTLAGESLKAIEIETVSAASQELLQANGFAEARYDPFTRALTSASGRDASSNRLFVRDWDFVAARVAQALRFRVLGREI